MGSFLYLEQTSSTSDFSEQFVLVSKSNPLILKAQGDPGKFDVNRF